MTSPWATVPRAPQNQQQQQQMPQQAQAQPQQTPDMTYPSFPNPAGLGSQVPFAVPPAVVPVPAYVQQPPQEQMQPMPDQMQQRPINPWGAMRGQ